MLSLTRFKYLHQSGIQSHKMSEGINFYKLTDKWNNVSLKRASTKGLITEYETRFQLKVKQLLFSFVCLIFGIIIIDIHNNFGNLYKIIKFS